MSIIIKEEQPENNPFIFITFEVLKLLR
jgi:hypothetical protein